MFFVYQCSIGVLSRAERAGVAWHDVDNTTRKELIGWVRFTSTVSGIVMEWCSKRFQSFCGNWWYFESLYQSRHGRQLC